MRRNLWTTLLCAVLLAAPVTDAHGQAAGGKSLRDAAATGDLVRVKALLAAKAHVNAKGNNGETPLMLAASFGHEEVVQALLAAKADVNAKMSDGLTALMAASDRGHKEVVQALLAAKADVNAKGDNGGTALMMASYRDYKEVLQALLAAKANVNAKADNGGTALLLAAANGNLEVVQALLDAKNRALRAAKDHAVMLPLSALVRRELATVDLVHLGDTSHSDNTSLMLWLGRKDTMRALAASGVKAIFLELTQTMQPVVDELWGGITPEQWATVVIKHAAATLALWPNFEDDMRRTAVMILQARSAGMRVYCADPHVAGDEEDKLEDHMRTLYAATPLGSRQRFEMLEADERTRLWQALPPETQSELEQATNAFLKKRLEKDADLAAFVNGKLGPGEKGILIYGALHGSGKRDLNEHLAALGTRPVKIDVFPDRAAYEYGVAGKMAPADPPRGYYILDRQVFYPAVK